MDTTTGSGWGEAGRARRSFLPWVVAGSIALAFILAATVGGVIAYRDAHAAAIAQTREELGATGQIRLKLLEDWRAERFLDAWAAAGSPALRETALRLLGEAQPTSSTTYAQAWTNVSDDLAMLRSKGGYAAAMLLDTRGRLIFASDANPAEITSATKAAVTEAVATGEPVLSEPWSSSRDRVTHLDVVAPIADRAGVVQGAVVLRVDPTQVLYDAVLGGESVDAETRLSVYDLTEDGVLEITPDGPSSFGAAPTVQRPVDPARSAFAAMIEGVAERTAAPAPPASDDPAAPTGASLTYQGPGDAGSAHVYADVRLVGDSDWVVVTERDDAIVQDGATGAGVAAVGRTGLIILAVALGVAGLLLVRQRRLLWRLTRAESDRAVATQRLDDVLVHGRDIVLLLDADGRILDANPPAVTAYGLSVDALRTRTIADLRTPEERWSVERDLLRAQAPGGARWSSVHLRGDGTSFPVEVIAHTLRDAEQARIEIVVQDVTGRRAAERTVQQQLDELRRWQAGAIGREERIIELKSEVNELLAQDGHPPRYASVEQVARVGHDG